MIGLILLSAYAAITIVLTRCVLYAEITPSESKGFFARTLSSLVQDRHDKAIREISRWRAILGKSKTNVE